MSPQHTSLPTGDTTVTTTEQGSVYADPGVGRLVRLADPENHDDYRVELWIAEFGEVTNTTQFWTEEDVTEFVELDNTEYLGGHCVDGHGPYGIWADNAADGYTCPACGADVEKGFTDTGTLALICSDRDAVGTYCQGRIHIDTLLDNNDFIPAAKYVSQRFGGA